MNAEIINVSGCKRKLVVEVPFAQVNDEIERLARSYASRAKVPGFRPGRVPLNVVRHRFATELRTEATQGLINRYWNEALAENHLTPLSEPRVEEVKDEAGEPLRFALAFEVMPNLEIDNYKGIEARLLPAEVSAAQVDEALEMMREQHGQFVPVEDAQISTGHLVTVKLDGEFDDGSKPLHEDDVTMVIGDRRTSEDFSNNLTGARIGDIRTFTVAFPADHPRKRFAGRKVTYKLEINDVKEKRVPELNDDFARDMGAPDMEALKVRVRADLVRNAERLAEEMVKAELVDKVVSSLQVDVPESLVVDELEEQAQQMAKKLAYQGIDISRTSIDWKKVFEEERPHAEQAVRRRMILEAIARQEGLDINETDLEEEIERLSRASEKSPAALRAQLEKDQRIQALRAHLLRNKALEFLYRNATISRG